MTVPVFVTHAVKDREIVNHVVDLLQLGMGVQHDEVFCSSIGGMDTPNGEYFVKDILEKLNTAKIVLGILSPAYFSSQFCLAEVGAAQLRRHIQKSTSFYSLLLPPADYDDLTEGVLYGVNSGKLTDTADLDELRDLVGKHGVKLPSTAVWNRKRGEFLARIRPLIQQRDTLALLDRLTVREAFFEPTKDPKITYQLKLRIVLRNDTGQNIRVKSPTWNGGPHGASIQQPFPASEFQLLTNGSWQRGVTELSVRAGEVFRFWIGLDPARGLRVMRENSRLGVVGLRVNILNNEFTWQRSL